jgi:hypothetical protein
MYEYQFNEKNMHIFTILAACLGKKNAGTGQRIGQQRGYKDGLCSMVLLILLHMTMRITAVGTLFSARFKLRDEGGLISFTFLKFHLC